MDCPKTFWAKTTCRAAYLINRSPSTAIKKKTPMKMWSGHPSNYEMLRIFGCVAYSHVKQGLSNRTPEEDHTDQEDGNDENTGDQETDQTTDLTDYQLVRDRESRTATKPLRFRDESNIAAYAFAATEEEDTHEPLTYQEAVACEDISKWKAAMEEEMDSLRKNKTWELVDHPAGQKLVSCKWEGINYNEVFSPVVRHTFIRFILALTACKDYELEQLDVKMAFLHGNLEEVIYMRQPPRYEQGNKLKREFDMKELEEAKKILGMEIIRDRSRKIMRVSQSGYVSKILNNFRIGNGKSVQMPLGRHFKLSLKDCPVKDCNVERMSKMSYANAVGRFKHEAFEKFKEWKQLVENQTGRMVKKMRTNNGLEFCNREFKQFCIKSEIARHLIVVGMP
nr:retrotransposon protein, putative, Ty1-copia subclass [Tanacetum cinerariifolium]